MNTAFNRWFLVFPVTILAWAAVIFIGVCCYSFIDSRCPPEDIISGMCMNPLITSLQDLTLLATPAISAITVVLTAAKIAPSHHNHVAALAYLLGACAALRLTDGLMRAESISALIGGALALAFQVLYKGKT